MAVHSNGRITGAASPVSDNAASGPRPAAADTSASITTTSASDTTTDRRYGTPNSIPGANTSFAASPLTVDQASPSDTATAMMAARLAAGRA
ncbi:MAG: hypothetical protein QM698_14350 [Micropepsaceae bacterium]